MTPDVPYTQGFRLRPLVAALALALAASAACGSDPHIDAIEPTGQRGGTTITVTNCNDSGPGSLREAYLGATDGDTIDLGTLTCSTITLSGPLVSHSVPGYVGVIGVYDNPVTVDGNNAGRAFVHASGRLLLRDVTITNGRAHDATGGGCIYSGGEVVLQRSRVSGCEVTTSGGTPALGGGVRALGTMFVLDTEITDNRAHAASADSAGGGLHARYLIIEQGSSIIGNVVSGDGTHFARGGGGFGLEGARVGYSVIADNEAGSGGGLFVTDASFYNTSITNGTISGNHAEGAGGGIYAQFNVRADNSTITGNSAVFDFGAGIYLGAGNAALQSTIIAGNTSGDGLNTSDIGGHAGAVISGANNLVIASTRPLPAGTIGDAPMLGPLQDNGGRTLTHALLPGSPAIDTGNNQRGTHTDQRAYDCDFRAVTGCVQFERVIGPSADIGAFEFGAPDIIFDDGFDHEA